MRIVLDLQSLQTTSSRNRGVGRYSLGLARAMIAQGNGHEFLIALNHAFPGTVEEVRQVFADILPPEKIRLFRIPTPVAELDPNNRWRGQAAELIRNHFLQDLQPDWIHVSSLFEGPEGNAITSVGLLPTAVTLYDLIPYLNSEHYLTNPTVKSWYMRKLAHLRNAELVLTISAHTRHEAIGALGLPADRVVDIPADADARFRVVKPDQQCVLALRARHGLSRDFVLYTGGIDYRKNIERLIEAYACLSPAVRMKHQLAIVCDVLEEDRRRLFALASRLGLSRDEVALTGYVRDEDLVALYNICKLFVFPSLHEGFGLPVLEAMRCGAPVIGSNRSSIPEVIALGAALFDPTSVESICAKMQEAITDDGFRLLLREQSRAQAGKFSWNASAKRALEALTTLHERREDVAHPRVQVQVSSSKPRLAYISPLPPERSGIADYSGELLPDLARYYEIDLITDLKEMVDPRLAANFRRRTVAEFERCAHEYDRVLYQFGNSSFHGHMFQLLARYPGTVGLHDFFLSGALHNLEARTPGSALFRQALYRSHGYVALRDLLLKGVEEIQWTYPCCLEVLENAQGVIVNSQYALHLTEKFFGRQAASHLVHIPQLRRLPKSLDRAASRATLGLSEDSFVICSFGFLGPTKLNDRLLSAWLSSDLAHDDRCHLVFVGDGQGSSFTQCLLQRMRVLGLDGRVKITGFASPETYQHYLAAADVAVQLRTRTRGETGRSPLDCLAWGVATVVNCHGALADLPDDVVVKLPDEFTDPALADTLGQLYLDPARREALGRAAMKYMREYPDTVRVARLYAEAIEAFAETHPVAARRRLLTAIASLAAPLARTEEDLAQVAEALSENLLSSSGRQLLVDISELAHRDSKTGIQRVTRALLQQLLAEPPAGFRVEPVYRLEGVYRYARQFMAGFFGMGELGLDDAPVGVRPGDIFLGLDLDPTVDESAKSWLRYHARRGLKVYFAGYDLLPLLRPDWFPLEFRSAFKGWLEGVASLADGVVCISRSVVTELGQWLEQHPVTRANPLRIGYFHLGADVEASFATSGISDDDAALLARMGGATTILMVGSFEPRKGHAQALEAFEALWAAGHEVMLVIVGKQCWMMEGLVQRLRSHPEFGRRLFWLEGASDELLLKLYRTASALLMASEGEGFGLPLIEAARHGLAIIARDLPVFREVTGDHAFYFNGANGRALADALGTWLGLYHRGEHPRSEKVGWLTWEESARQLKDVLLKSRWAAVWEPGRGFSWHASDSVVERAPGGMVTTAASAPAVRKVELCGRP